MPTYLLAPGRLKDLEAFGGAGGNGATLVGIGAQQEEVSNSGSLSKGGDRVLLEVLLLVPNSGVFPLDLPP